MALIYKRCPNCGSKNVVKIVYGMPTSEISKEAEQGKIELNGCIIVEGCSEYSCKDCSYEWNRQQVIDEAYKKILNIKASVGRFFGSSYEVELDFKNNKITWDSREDGNQDTITKVINEDEKQIIIEHLKRTNLLIWRAMYIEPNICDGTQWCIKIETIGRIIRKCGSNKYPKEWELFCNLIEEKSGRAFG